MAAMCRAMPLPGTINAGGVAEWLKAPVLKTGRGLVSLVGSNPTPTVSLPRTPALGSDGGTPNTLGTFWVALGRCFALIKAWGIDKSSDSLWSATYLQTRQGEPQ